MSRPPLLGPSALGPSDIGATLDLPAMADTPLLPNPIHPISLPEACAALPSLWSPRILAQANGQLLKVARVLGDFPWHTHDAEDELFLVLKGALTIHRALPDGGPVTLHPGQAFVIPRGTRHSTGAAEETWIALFEPVSTAHTGTEQTPLTRTLAQQLDPAPQTNQAEQPDPAQHPSPAPQPDAAQQPSPAQQLHQRLDRQDQLQQLEQLGQLDHMAQP